MKRFANTCVIYGLYNLFLYLLVADEDAVDTTLFFVCRTFPVSVRNRIKHIIELNVPDMFGGLSRLMRLKIRIKFIFYNFLYLRNTNVYAQDHLGFSSPLLCNARYTLLEDAPGVFSCVNPNEPFAMKPQRGGRAIFGYIMRGYIRWRVLGTNDHCINRIVTDKNDAISPLLINRKVTYVDIQSAWNQSTEQKQNMILNVFGVNPVDFSEFNAETIILTQPFAEDALFDMSVDEVIEMWTPVVKKYVSRGVVIKPHPRDRVDYKRYFPNAMVIDAKIPMQLVNLLKGRDFKRAVTVYSTAVFGFSNKVEIVRLGPQIHPKILAVYNAYARNIVK